MSEWPTIPLADVLVLDIDSVDVVATDIYPIVGVLNRGRGLLYRDPIRGSETAYKSLNAVHPSRVIYSRLKAFEGAITVVPDYSQITYASPEFPTFRCTSELLPEFFKLLTTTRSLWEELQGLSTGMGGRRERVKPAAFLSIRIKLPPAVEQRRIVVVMSTIDAQIGALQTELAAERATRRPLLSDLLSHGGAVPTELGAVGTFIRGRRFTKAQFTDGGLGCIHYAEVHTHFGPIATATVRSLDNDLRTQMRLACRGDVVVAATSENLADLGKATAWLGEREVAVHDDCYIFRHELDPRFASYLFASAEFQREKVQYASGTKVTRISGENLGKIKVPIPPYSTQVAIGQQLSSMDAAAEARRSELAALRHVRTDLLNALLSQEVTVGEAVDQFIEPAA